MKLTRITDEAWVDPSRVVGLSCVRSARPDRPSRTIIHIDVGHYVECDAHIDAVLEALHDYEHADRPEEAEPEAVNEAQSPDPQISLEDTNPCLIESLHVLGGRYGPTGVVWCAEQLWPDARFGGNIRQDTDTESAATVEYTHADFNATERAIAELRDRAMRAPAAGERFRAENALCRFLATSDDPNHREEAYARATSGNASPETVLTVIEAMRWWS